MIGIKLTDNEWERMKQHIKTLFTDEVVDSLPDKLEDAIMEKNLRYILEHSEDGDTLTIDWKISIGVGAIRHFARKMRREMRDER